MNAFYVSFVRGGPLSSVTAVIYMGILQITLVVTLIMILAMMAPALVARVLGLAPEDAVLFFAPSGLGMGLAILVLARWGSRCAPRLAANRHALPGCAQFRHPQPAQP